MFIKVHDKYGKELRINVDAILYYTPTSTSTEIKLKDKSFISIEESAEEIDKMIELVQINKQPKEIFRPIANPIFNKSRKFKISYSSNNNDSMVFLTNLFAHDSYEAFEDTKKYIKSNIDDLNSLFLDTEYITLCIRDENYFKEDEYKLFKSDVQNLVSLKK